MLFGKNKKQKKMIVAPVAGVIKKIESVDDEAISQKALGDGFAITPTESNIYCPITGKVQFVFHTKHAIGIVNGDIEILLHIGIDTVALQGEGFECFVEKEQEVKQGDLLMKVDFNTIKDKVPSIDVIVLFSSGQACKLLKENRLVEAKETEIVEVK